MSQVVITLASAIKGEGGTINQKINSKNRRVSVTFVQLTRHYYRAMQEISFRNDILPLKDKLYRLAFRITLNSAEAEDVVQDTMIRVWDKRDEWPNFESIEAYCLTVARNLAIDRIEKIDSQHMELTPETQELPDALNPYEQLAQSEQLGLIHRLLNELPEKQRSIMQLRDIEGKSYKEIADILQITEEQVKINLFRSRQKIKQR